jgi:hypothetical protein
MKKNSMMVDRKRTREVVVVAAVIKIPGIVWRSKEIENGGNGKGVVIVSWHMKLYTICIMHRN